MERSGTRRGMATAGLILSMLVAACSAASPSASGEDVSPSPMSSPSPTGSPVGEASPDPAASPDPVGEASPPSPDDDEYAEPGVDACGLDARMTDGSVAVACMEGETGTYIDRYVPDGDRVPGWPVSLDGVVAGNSWN